MEEKCRFAWLKVTVSVLASGHRFPDAKCACCKTRRLMCVVTAAKTHTKLSAMYELKKYKQKDHFSFH